MKFVTTDELIIYTGKFDPYYSCNFQMHPLPLAATPVNGRAPPGKNLSGREQRAIGGVPCLERKEK